MSSVPAAVARSKHGWPQCYADTVRLSECVNREGEVGLNTVPAAISAGRLGAVLRRNIVDGVNEAQSIVSL